MDSAVGASRPFEAIYSVLQGVDQTEYNLVINGTTYSYTTTTTASTYQTTEIVDQIVSQISGLSGFTVTDLGSDIYISNSSDFTISSTVLFIFDLILKILSNTLVNPKYVISFKL